MRKTPDLSTRQLRAFLALTEHRNFTRAAQASQQGITGVPFFVFGEKYALSGAQPAEVFTRALAQTIELDLAWEFAPDEEFGFADLARDYFSAAACCSSVALKTS